MTKEMTENVPTQELEPQPVKDIKFVEKAADEMSDVLSKYAIVPTPDALLLQEEELTSKTDEQIAEMLKKVEVIDPTFEPQNMEASSDQGVFNVGVLAAAKAKSVAAQTENKDVKRRLEEWEERVLSGVSSKIAKIGGKKATGIALAGIVSIGMTACGVSGVAGVNPGQVPTEPAPRVTQVTEVPTETPTQAPTEIPTPTENPNAFSSEEALANCPVKLEVNKPLVGVGTLKGDSATYELPTVKTDIVFGIDKSVVERQPKSVGFSPISFDNIIVNPDFETNTGADPEVTVEVDTWYMYYKAWQHDNNNEFFKERENISFQSYLDKVQKGEDVSFHLWVVTKKDSLYPDSQIKIDPREVKLQVVFVDNLGGFNSEFAYDDKSNTFVIFSLLYNTPLPEGPSSNDFAWGWVEWLSSMELMSGSEKIQRYPITAETADEAQKLTLEVSYDITKGITIGTVPFLTTSQQVK